MTPEEAARVDAMAQAYQADIERQRHRITMLTDYLKETGQLDEYLRWQHRKGS